MNRICPMTAITIHPVCTYRLDLYSSAEGGDPEGHQSGHQGDTCHLEESLSTSSNLRSPFSAPARCSKRISASPTPEWVVKSFPEPLGGGLDISALLFIGLMTRLSGKEHEARAVCLYKHRLLLASIRYYDQRLTHPFGEL